MRPVTAGPLCVCVCAAVLLLFVSPYDLCNKLDTDALDSALSIADRTAADDELDISLIAPVLLVYTFPMKRPCPSHDRGRGIISGVEAYYWYLGLL